MIFLIHMLCTFEAESLHICEKHPVDEECIKFYNPDIVKIDRALISNIHKNVTNQKALIDICNYLEKKGIIILAEGVETQEEYDYLKKYPIKLMQGYFFGKPQIFKDYSK